MSKLKQTVVGLSPVADRMTNPTSVTGHCWPVLSMLLHRTKFFRYGPVKSIALYILPNLSDGKGYALEKNVWNAKFECTYLNFPSDFSDLLES